MATGAPEPRLGFVIGGVQKSGTSALARYLSMHPGIALPARKEAHVFDAAVFDEAWPAWRIDARLAPHFAGASPEALHGDATPFYVFHPRVVARIARYNPAMRWIVLLRDPADRAISHYRMERNRGHERLPPWLAMLLEPWRLRGHANDLARGSVLRRHSYRARGDYARQLDVLHAHFPREQVLLLHSDRLREDPAAIVTQACAFLGVAPPPAGIDYSPVFVGSGPAPPRDGKTMRLLRWLLRRELRDMRARYGIDFP